ncbi:hypothetical protein [Ruegeria arenilitoris]|uniref:hypothetical protein n=1 Tax=Ruegeria arenilitoris TaxID=1173585 RepID=UPI003C7B9977
MLTVHTAADHTRRLVKDQGFSRSRLHQISKAEEAGAKGATAERLKVTAYLQKEIDRAERSISDTRAASIRYQRAASILRSTVPTWDSTDPLHQKCADLVRIDYQSVGNLADQFDRIAKQANDAAERAADRLAKADMDLRTTAALAAYLAKLADRNFKSDKQTERLRQSYLAFKRAAA